MKVLMVAFISRQSRSCRVEVVNLSIGQLTWFGQGESSVYEKALLIYTCDTNVAVQTCNLCLHLKALPVEECKGLRC